MLLCALPPDQNTFDRPGCEFTDFDDLVRFWGQNLAEISGWNIVVRPHPKTARGRLEALRLSGINVTYDDTAGLIPICDLYVASISSTIRWAIACAKPVLNYDVYQYDYGDYDGVEGVALVNTKEEFRKLLQSMTSDRECRDRMTVSQQREAGRWGCFDGMSGQRILALVRGERLPAPDMIRKGESAAWPVTGLGAAT